MSLDSEFSAWAPDLTVIDGDDPYPCEVCEGQGLDVHPSLYARPCPACKGSGMELP